MTAGRWLTGDPVPGAFTRSGTVYAREPMSGLSILDRSERKWRQIVPPAVEKLLGHDGGRLVFLEGNVVTWIPAPVE